MVSQVNHSSLLTILVVFDVARGTLGNAEGLERLVVVLVALGSEHFMIEIGVA